MAAPGAGKSYSRVTGASALTGVSIAIPLLDELTRDLRIMPTALKKELQQVIDRVGNTILVPHIKNNVIPQRGLIGKERRPDGSVRKGYRPGSLQRGVRARVKPQTLEGILEDRASAKGNRHSLQGGGYPYPLRYEYGARGNQETGKRAFLWPGVVDKSNEVFKAIDDGLYAALVKHGW